ncbi:GRF1-interacting factor 2 [Selaginella moellendorffii]|nr:GRF1-interacting factor 2 [Selaginella moellendorffii]|eukprot:XP_024520829.1 GRF1-interacting factor 2 [Selaginella moellendorffii]
MQAPQMGPYTGTMITTELIQKYLDENKQLILAILDNQNLGKLHECAAYQSKLQQNLMYLAAIADAQPQNPLPGGQVAQASMLQGTPQFMQQSPQQMGMMDQQQQQQQNYTQIQMAALHALQAQQRQQQFQQQQRLVTAAASAGMLLQPPHSELELGGGGNVSNGNNMTGMGGAFPDYAAAAGNGDLMRNSAAAAVSGDASKGTSAVAGSSGATAADGTGDDAGSTFLKSSEEE